MRLRLLGSGVVTVCLLALTACGQRAAAVEFRHGYAFTRAERRAIEAVADRAVRDVRHHLPALPSDVTITVQAGTKVLPETGETGEVGLPTSVYWTVDPKHPGGVIAVVNAQLRATLFHELYHLVREAHIAPVSLTDQAINEGLATAFERDFGGAPAPWGAYPSDVKVWTKEFLALPRDAPRDQWMYKHADGRRWIGYKVGTYLADQAARVSGFSLAQLATVPTASVVQWGWSVDRNVKDPNH
jgi:uncharacterized protein YjaZ